MNSTATAPQGALVFERRKMSLPLSLSIGIANYCLAHALEHKHAQVMVEVLKDQKVEYDPAKLMQQLEEAADIAKELLK